MSVVRLTAAMAERDAARASLDTHVAMLKAHVAPAAVAGRTKRRALALTADATQLVEHELRRRPAAYAIAGIGLLIFLARRPIANGIGRLRKPARGAGVERPYPGDRLDRRTQRKDTV